jgi:hypothetical protein
MARVIEEKIIGTINNWKEGEHRLSKRDRVAIEGNKAIYYLWTSPVFSITKEIDGKKSINFSFHNWGSQTTKERISELLWAFADSKTYVFRRNWLHYLKMDGKYYWINESKTYAITDGRLFESVSGKEVEPEKFFKE